MVENQQAGPDQCPLEAFVHDKVPIADANVTAPYMLHQLPSHCSGIHEDRKQETRTATCTY